jgi:hypothetical protein
VGAGFAVTILDALGEVDFLLNGEKGRSGDFPEIQLETGIGFVGHNLRSSLVSKMNVAGTAFIPFFTPNSVLYDGFFSPIKM